jgi:TatD DNase family protein
LAAKYPKVLYSTAGVHPHDAKSCNSNTIETLKKLAASPNVCAIGETGLGKDTFVFIVECNSDFDRMFSPREVQEHWFEKQVFLF